jgi:prepilin-type processing-associated H-X9-DG protein
MGRRILIVALTAVCAAPVAAYEIEPVFVKSWSMSGDGGYQGGTGTFFLKNSNAPSTVEHPTTSPLKTVPPATTPTMPSRPHSNGANAALHDGSVRFNPVGKPGAFAGAHR